MTAFNRRDYIALAIQSVIGQTRKDWELIVWDDGSTDDTVAVATAAAAGDPRVQIMSGKGNVGFAASINHAAAKANGVYLGWVDSDDLIAETALADTSAVLDGQPNVGVVYSDYISIDQQGKVRGLGKRSQVPYSRDRLLVDFMTFQFRLMRRALFTAIGGLDPAVRYAADYDACLKLSEMTQFHHIAKPLYFYRMHEQTISRQNRLNQIEESAEVIRRALVRRGLDRQFELEVNHVATFHLRKKNTGAK